MLPAFVIGLREGLETVVIIGAIAIFLRSRGRADLLSKVWRASALAAAICIVVGVVIRLLEVNLPWRQQEQLETVVGLAAVAMVTYMVVWMRRFPKDLQRDTQAAVESALERDSARALVALAFFAVLREGFEIVVFVTATVGSSASNAWLAASGAVLGVVVALAAGVGIAGGSLHVDIPRFFRATALVLVLTAAGIAMSTVHSANAAGWITFGQTPQFDLSWLAPPGSVLSSFTTGMFGLQPYPVIVEVVAWLAYLVPMTLVVLWPTRAARSADVAGAQSRESARSSHSRTSKIATLLGCAALISAGAGYAIQNRRSAPSRSHAVGAHRVLYARLSGASCASSVRCVAVGEFLPLDKDAAAGDPDGDGQATRTLAETFGRSGWRLLASPDEGRGGAALAGVSCPSATSCVAVGSYRPGTFPLSAKDPPPQYPLIEAFNGRSWRIFASPLVAANSILESVSCTSSSFCVAVGSTTTDITSAHPGESPFVEELRGGTWRVVRVPQASESDAGLSAVSCARETSCVAVGNVAPTIDPTVTHPLIETLTGSVWQLTLVPPPADGRGILYDVACVSIGRCIAVGATEVRDPAGSALVLATNGASWSVNSAAMSSRQANSLSAVACTTAEDCLAAGSFLPSLVANPERVLARVDASSLHRVVLSSEAVNIEGIACENGSRCLLVGSAPQNVFGNTEAWVAALAGGSWTTFPSPVP